MNVFLINLMNCTYLINLNHNETAIHCIIFNVSIVYI